MISVKESREKGKVIIACQLIPAKTVVSIFTGAPIKYEETIRLGNRESFALQIAPKDYILLDRPFRYYNHSCNPNCGLGPDLLLITLEDIPEGTELTYDYSTTMLEHHWQMKCACREKICRGVVKDFITLPKERQEFYLQRNMVQQFIVDALPQ